MSFPPDADAGTTVTRAHGPSLVLDRRVDDEHVALVVGMELVDERAHRRLGIADRIERKVLESVHVAATVRAPTTTVRARV